MRNHEPTKPVHDGPGSAGTARYLPLVLLYAFTAGAASLFWVLVYGGQPLSSWALTLLMSGVGFTLLGRQLRRMGYVSTPLSLLLPWVGPWAFFQILTVFIALTSLSGMLADRSLGHWSSGPVWVPLLASLAFMAATRWANREPIG